MRAEYDLVVIDGAGSPAEINLRGGDIVKMEVALHAQAPVVLVGDIDKGGVFAQRYGTLELIAPEEKALVAGMVINKFRGDVKVLELGLVTLEELTGKPVFGVVPYLRDLRIAEEDSPFGQPPAAPDSLLDLAVIVLPHIANFDPLTREPDVGLRYVRRLEELGVPDLVMLSGTKTTVADLGHLRKSGLSDSIVGLAASSTAVLGICGGFQMLGRSILDPSGVESASREGRMKKERGWDCCPSPPYSKPPKRPGWSPAELWRPLADSLSTLRGWPSPATRYTWGQRPYRELSRPCRPD